VSIFHANSRLNELSVTIADAVRTEFKRFGLEVVNFNVERISMPEEDMQKFQQILGKVLEIDQLSKAQVGSGYTTVRTFDVLDKVASTEGGTAGDLLAGGLGVGVALGAGLPFGQQISQAIGSQRSQPPASSSSPDDTVSKLQTLKRLLENELISQSEFDARKKQILDSL